MISKKIMILNTILAVFGIVAFFFFQYQMRPEKRGGFKEGTEEYFGYRYAGDNELKSVDQCDDEKDDPEMNVNAKFMKGCEAFFRKK